MSKLREVFLCPCGASVDHQTDVYFRDEYWTTITICERCRLDSDRQSTELRAEFEALLEQGIDTRLANRIMATRIDRRFADGTYRRAAER